MQQSSNQKFQFHLSASSSSSVGNLGSPKPEKRQANSPLPPTPKSTHYLSNSNLTNSSSVPSGRNSAASVIEVQPIGSTSRQVSRENLSVDSKKHSNDDFVRKKGHIEDLYAKVRQHFVAQLATWIVLIPSGLSTGYEEKQTVKCSVAEHISRALS